jgi:hypothetical protein
VKKQDIVGETRVCNEYILRDSSIETVIREKTFGKEKGKLVIQELGIHTIDFLLRYFHHVFSYDYTRQMENRLDEIEHNPIIYKNVCGECANEIRDILKEIRRLTKQVFPINEEYHLIFKKNGIPVLVKEGQYKNVKPDLVIDMDKLKAGLYTYDELVQKEYMGIYEEQELLLKKGLHGYYVEWGENRENIDKIGIPIDKITMDDIIHYLSIKKTPCEKNILRVLDEDHSIRRGPHGFYVYIMKDGWKKPTFVSLKKFKGDFLSVDASVLIDFLIKKG